MKRTIVIIFVVALAILSTSCERHTLGRAHAEETLRKALSDTTSRPHTKPYLADQAAAIKGAEAVLFSVYGEDQIKDERPYEVYLIDGYWVLSGTLPMGWDGGTFEIILGAHDGCVVSLKHSK